VQENFSFVAVHLRFPSAASHAATFLTQSRSGRPAGRPLADAGPGFAQRRHCPANALRAATRLHRCRCQNFTVALDPRRRGKHPGTDPHSDV
jgi:hypothetical protein